MLPSIDQLSVVVIDDDPDHVDLLVSTLESASVRPQAIHSFSDPAEAIARLPANGPTVILCDYNMPGGTGLEWLGDLLKSNIGPVIMLTAEGDEHIAAEAFRHGVADYLIKDEVIGQPEVLIGSIRDALRCHHLEQSVRSLTEQLKEANHDLEKNNANLAELTRTAHRFVDNVAHEFRTPLAVIQEFTAILAEGLGGQVNDQQREYLTYIGSATRELAQMVDDLLDSSRLKARTLRVERGAHDPAGVIDAVLPAIVVRGKTKRISVEKRVEPGLSAAYCDAEKVGRILVNLAINAIKFSPDDGSIVIWADAGNGSEVRIGVTDHGPGLCDEDIAALGERFKQFGDPQQSPAKGFGLGLNIAKELVALNLGRMQVESKRGEGSTFSFTLPTCDLEQVVRRYAQTIDDHLPDTMLCLLRAGQRDPGSAEAAAAALSKLSYPMDLVIPTTAGDAVLLLGASEQPDRWIERIDADYKRAAHRRRETDQQPLPTLELTWVRSWPPSKQRKTMPLQVHDMLVGLSRCA